MPFLIGFYVRSGSTAMDGRYTFTSCRAAAICALLLGPLGFATGIYTLVKLHEPGVRESFNS